MRFPLFDSTRLRVSLLLGSGTGLALGCVITLGPLEPCESGNDNHLNSDDECECDVGYEWCNPEDPADLSCCEDPNFVTGGDGGTSDGSSGDGDSSSGDGDGDDGTTGDGDGGTPPPDSCDPSSDLFWCTHSEAMGPEGSTLYVCDGDTMMWVEDTENLGDQSCVVDGWDFAFGCVTTTDDVVFECGTGSGAPCMTGDPASCADMDLLQECVWGKSTETSCQWFCENVGVDGITYEFGECAVVNGVADCDCYDGP